MAFVRIEQRNAHLAGKVMLDNVNSRDGKLARASFTAISNTRRGSGEQREEKGRLRTTRPGAKRGRRANATRAEAVEAWKQLGQALAMSADPADLALSRSIASLLVVFNGLRLLGGEREFNGEAGPAK